MIGAEHLSRYSKVYGHADVPQRFRTADGYPLGTWLRSQRERRAMGTLQAWRVEELDALGVTWAVSATRFEDGLAHLREYVAEHGTADVPHRYECTHGFALGHWVSNLRRRHLQGGLDEDRERALDAAGMVWSPRDEAWDRAALALADFIDRQGHANVPTDWITPDGLALGTWLHHQRAAHAAGSLPQQRAARLASLSAVTGARDLAWATGLAALQQYAAENGHTLVPVAYSTPEGLLLGRWVAQQRQRRHNLPTARRDTLDEMGFVWNTAERAWRVAVAALEAFVAEAGHADVPATHVTPVGFHLGSWLGNQRTLYAGGSLPPDRVRELEALSVTWRVVDVEQLWRDGLAHLDMFITEHGHPHVAANYVSPDGHTLGT
nr:helicase associated domain-containing protein [Cellulomonas hominis]